MCIAIVKPKGAKIPDKATLEICWKNNPDGAGFVYSKKNNLHIRKGFMTFKAFYENFETMKFTDQDEIGIHFRIGTSGGRSAMFTHPFPISNKLNDLRKLSITCKGAVMHNGILGHGDFQRSDTMIFIQEQLFLLAPYLHEANITELISNLTSGSRLAIFYNGMFKLFGKWIDDSGVFYSNDGYIEQKNHYVFSSYKVSDKKSIRKVWQEVLSDTDTIEDDNVFVCPDCGKPFDIEKNDFCPHCFYFNT